MSKKQSKHNQNPEPFEPFIDDSLRAQELYQRKHGRRNRKQKKVKSK